MPSTITDRLDGLYARLALLSLACDGLTPYSQSAAFGLHLLTQDIERELQRLHEELESRDEY